MDNKNMYDEKQESMKRLSKYASILNLAFNDYNRKSTDETMMIKSYRKSDGETTNRKTHSENLENIATIIAEQLDLNVPVVKLMAKHHDIGHTFLGHSGEWWISEIKKNLGLGYYVHNSLGSRDLLYINKIKEQVKDSIAQVYLGDVDKSDEEIDKVCDDLWIILDGINSHNGELSEATYIPNIGKSQTDFEQELLDCHVKEGYDRKLAPATTEGCLMRLCDKISYIPYDMVDGLREGMIDKLDEEYINVLVPILTSDKKTTVEEALKLMNSAVEKQKYNELAHRLQLIFARDVMENSSKEKIAMSEEMSKLMHTLRDINNRQIVNYVLMQEDHEVYPKALAELMQECKDIIMNEDILDRLNGADEDMELSKSLNKKYKDTPYIGFVKYIGRTNREDFEWTQNMIKEARKQAINDELDEGLKVATDEKEIRFVKGQEKRARRIRFYSEMYEEQINKMRERGYHCTEEDYEKMKKFQLEKTSKKLYPNDQESLALEFGAKYLASLNDTEFMELLRATGKVTDKQFASLTRKYKDINLQEEYMTHSNWDIISGNQSKQLHCGSEKI